MGFQPRVIMMGRRPEEQLLLYCATTHMDEGKVHKVRAILGKDLDWDYILGIHSLTPTTPLLFHNLRKITGRNSISNSVVDGLRASYVAALRKNMEIYRELHGILAELQNKGISVILLKGVALAEIVYQDIALRPMNDIDIMVRKADLHDVVTVLSKQGYVPSHSDDPFYEGHHHIVPYERHDRERNNFFVMELHHNIAPAPLMSRIDVDYLWENPQVFNTGGIDALALSAENTLLHLCLHLSTISFINGVRILVDISETIRCYDGKLDWHSFVRKSNELGVGSSVYYPLWWAREIMDIDIPTQVLNGLKLDPELNFFEAKLLKAIIGKNLFETELDRSLFTRSVAAARKSLCEELLWTSRTGDRIKHLIVILPYALGKIYHEHVRKDAVLRPIRWRSSNKKGRRS